MKPEETISKLANAIVLLTVLIFFLIGIILYLVFRDESPEEEQVIDCVDYIDSPYDLNNRTDYRIAANFIGHEFNPDNGEVLTKVHCLSCHKLSDYKLVGPPLNKLIDRLPQKENWLLDFLTNSDSLYSMGDTHVVALRQEYKLIDWNHEIGNLRKDQLIDIAGFIMMSN